MSASSVNSTSSSSNSVHHVVPVEVLAPVRGEEARGVDAHAAVGEPVGHRVAAEAAVVGDVAGIRAVAGRERVVAGAALDDHWDADADAGAVVAVAQERVEARGNANGAAHRAAGHRHAQRRARAQAGEVLDLDGAVDDANVEAVVLAAGASVDERRAVGRQLDGGRLGGRRHRDGRQRGGHRGSEQSAPGSPACAGAVRAMHRGAPFGLGRGLAKEGPPTGAGGRAQEVVIDVEDVDAGVAGSGRARNRDRSSRTRAPRRWPRTRARRTARAAGGGGRHRCSPRPVGSASGARKPTTSARNGSVPVSIAAWR